MDLDIVQNAGQDGLNLTQKVLNKRMNIYF